MPYFGGGAVAVIRHGFHYDGHSAGAVALVGDALEAEVSPEPRAFSMVRLMLSFGIFAAFALVMTAARREFCSGRRFRSLLPRLSSPGNFCKGLGSLGVLGSFGLLNIVPLGMSGHGFFPL
jgi:hypothetical protein